MAWAAVFLTYGDMSDAASLMASIIMGTIMVTLMLERTRRALALMSWLGSCRSARVANKQDRWSVAALD